MVDRISGPSQTSSPSFNNDIDFRTPPAPQPDTLEIPANQSCFSQIWDLLTRFFSWLFCCGSFKETASNKPVENSDKTTLVGSVVAANAAAETKPIEDVFDPMWAIRGQKKAQDMIASLMTNLGIAPNKKIPEWNWIIYCNFHAQLESIESLEERFFACDELADQLIAALHQAVAGQNTFIIPKLAERILDYCISLGNALAKIKDSGLRNYGKLELIRNWLGYPSMLFSRAYIQDKIFRYFKKNEEALGRDMVKNYPDLYVKMGECRSWFSGNSWKNPNWRIQLPLNETR